MRRLILPACLLLGACMPGPNAEISTRAAMPDVANMTPIKVFATAHPVPPMRANSDIARDFMDLAMTLESGRPLPMMTRFEGPITLRLTGAVPPVMQADLTRLLGRLHREAGITITQVTGLANITIEAVSSAQIRRALPQAACFVVPNITEIGQYRAAERRGLTAWSALRTRQKLAIFIPNDTSPQEARDCLHEELAQALGPLDDLYRLPDSVFNDDNVHTVLTGFDMLILRAYYAPELHSGMTRAQVAARLPAILRRLNPGGEHIAPHPAPATPRAWIDAIQTALGTGTSPPRHRAAAERALAIASAAGWRDQRRAFSHYALARVVQASDPALAKAQFAAADAWYRRSPITAPHRAHTAAQLAAYAIAEGRGAAALALIDPQIPVAERNENAALLAQLKMLRAEALDMTGRPAEARVVRMDSLGWARYGYGADWVVRARMGEVAALNPLKAGSG